ncbi:MAG: hypothetical protein LBB95_00870 [Mycoplasmataceae bacterium]|nr:hypothetical protein [Mycoplasmataceae bacterium]
MVSKTFLNKHANAIKHNLNTIFDNSFLAPHIVKNNGFKEIIEIELSILNTIDPKEFKPLIAKYNEVAKTKFQPKTLKYDEEYEYTDQNNWLVLYCKNNFNIDITSKNPVVNNEINKQLSVANNDTKKLMFSGDVISKSKKFSDDVRLGKIYLYKTKPRIVKILKICFMYCFLIFTVLMSCTTAVFFMTSTDNFTAIDRNSYGISEGVFWLLFSFFAWKPTYTNFINWYKKNNDNYRYYFQYVTISLFCVFLGVFFLTDILSIDDQYPTIFQKWIHVLLTTNDSYVYDVTLTLFILYASTIFFFVVSVIIMIIAVKANPKQDSEKTARIFKEYVSDKDEISKA